MIKVFTELLWIIAIRPVSYGHLLGLFANVVLLFMESTTDLITTSIVFESLIIIPIVHIVVASMISNFKHHHNLLIYGRYKYLRY
jgi:hypothetical protein